MRISEVIPLANQCAKNRLLVWVKIAFYLKYFENQPTHLDHDQV